MLSKTEEITERYYRNNAKKLRELTDLILIRLKFHNIDKEDFYSLANEVFVDVLKRYDTSRDFQAFLYSCLLKKFKTEMTRKTRNKRCMKVISVQEEPDGNVVITKDIIPDVSLDMPINENGDDCLSLLYDHSDFEGDFLSEQTVDKVLSSMSKVESQIILMCMDGYTMQQIADKLHKPVSRVEKIKANIAIKPQVLRAINLYIKKEDVSNAYY